MFGSCFRTLAGLVTYFCPEKRYDLTKVFLFAARAALLYILVFSLYFYYMHVLRSKFGHVYLVTSLVYLQNFLYVNYWWFGGRTAQHLFILSIVCVYSLCIFCTAVCEPVWPSGKALGW